MPRTAPASPFILARRLLSAAVLALALAVAQAAAQAPVPAEGAGDAGERLQVAEAFLEMHTGPGRGYPVFHVVERQRWVMVELRHTDWYRVRAEGGQVGWVHRASRLSQTLTAAGARKAFRDVLLDDFLGPAARDGRRHGPLQGRIAAQAVAALPPGRHPGCEVSTGQVQGVFSGTELWSLSLTSEPWSDQRWSPFLSVGVGQFRNIPNTSLVDAAPVNARLAHATVGLRWHLTQRFTARLDWSLYTAFVADQRSTEYRAFSAGLAFFF
jgi:SH3-like domain-containing protein